TSSRRARRAAPARSRRRAARARSRRRGRRRRASPPRRAQRAKVVIDLLEHVVRDDRGTRSLRCFCDVELAYRYPLVTLEPGPQFAEEIGIQLAERDALQPAGEPGSRVVARLLRLPRADPRRWAGQ